MKIFQNKYIDCYTFINPDHIEMFGLQFLVGENSDNSYRGFRIKKSKKVAKWLHKLANKLEKL